MPFNRIRIFLLFIIIYPFDTKATILHTKNNLLPVKVWIYFTDKPINGTAVLSVSPRALARRRAVGFNYNQHAADRSISDNYIRSIEQCGGLLRHCFPWENAASFEIPLSALSNISSLPHVKKISRVARYRRTVASPCKAASKKSATPIVNYGSSLAPLLQLNIPAAHRYLSYRFPDAQPGAGVRIAFFDGGFNLQHRCFKHLLNRIAIVGTYDFVDHDTSVADPDSTTAVQSHPYYENDRHGSEVFSIVAGYDTSFFCGAAWGADFLLARTEDSYMYNDLETRELHIEEDNWAAAVVWAESLGVDIISSSVAYRSEFEDTIVIERTSGVFDTIVDYLKSDMNGTTAIVSRAAQAAVERGVVIVSAIGNEGHIDGDTSLDAPSDVEGVISVGSVDSRGRLSYFSSLGPTADGRIKPDVVAPGASIRLPDVYSDESTDFFGVGNGTSYAAPFVSGICALIKQSYPDSEAASLRNRLYRFCRLPDTITAANNGYGRGIPDALLSCMHDNEVFLTVIDTGNHPFAGGILFTKNGDTLARTDSNGTCLFTLSAENDSSVTVSDGNRQRLVRIDSTPFYRELSPCSLVVIVEDEEHNPVPACSLYYRVATTWHTSVGDTNGNAVIARFVPQTISVVVTKEYFLPSDTLTVDLEETKKEHTVTLAPSAHVIYPKTVYQNSRFHHGGTPFKIKLPFSATPRDVVVSIYTINGIRIWNHSQRCDASINEIVWDCRNRRGVPVAPGTYILSLQYFGKKISEKFVLS